MAGVLVGGAFLSASLQVLCQSISSRDFLDLFRRKKLDESLVKKFNVTLLTLGAVLDDAEEKEIRSIAVREWLCELQEAVFEAEDLLDEINTQVLQSKLEADEYQTDKLHKVRNFFSSSLNRFYARMNGRIAELFQRLEHLAKQKDVLGLLERVTGKVPQRTPSTSFIEHEFCAFGREGDKEKLETILLSDDAACSSDVAVVPIVGMGGVGKTTLAQLLYNDEKVKEHFDLKAWVHVSEDFDAVRVTKTLLESITSKPCQMFDLNSLQVQLQEHVKGKKFLLVLDDLWNDNYSDWNLLRAPFTFGTRGSKVIVTTRNISVASIMHTVPIHYLEQLSHEDCWLLLAKHAFRYENPRAYPNLEELSKQIARKRNGLPLAAKMLGGLLSCNLDYKEWSIILNSTIWELLHDKGILPALRLSYHYLPAYLKRCFAYCSIFPKNYNFKKKDVILLWAAEGLFPQAESEERMEEIGEKYFDELLSRSLFQRSQTVESSFTMHDLINDLALLVSREFCLRFEEGELREVPKRVRHFSYVNHRCDLSLKFEPLYGVKCLRTFLPMPLRSYYTWEMFYVSERIPQDLLPELRCLRVLSLSNYKNITQLPDSIANLIHLRYMDLSYTAIKRLPDIVCTLYNLQTLILSYCSSLTELPTNMRKLINLRHLDTSGTRIEEMPLQMGRLKSLRTLTAFVVGKSTGSSIRELRELLYLRGELSILKLQNVVDDMDALHANLKDKKDLKEIVLTWGRDTSDSQNERDVLDSLQPPLSLEKLTIRFYGGTCFPKWLGDTSFSNIQFMHFSDCSYCLSLPPLGQLPTLKELSIVRMRFLTTIGPEFYGNGSSLIQPFHSLEKLEFKEMLEWEEWLPSGSPHSDFPRLQELLLHGCPKLRGNLPNHLSPSLKRLRVSECLVLHETATTSLDMDHLLKSVEELQINGCPGLLSLLGAVSSLQVLILQNSSEMEYLPKNLVHNSIPLKTLIICNCPSLLSFPSDGLPATLTSLRIEYCRRLEFLTHVMMASLASLQGLHIVNSCDSIRSFPLGIFPKLSSLEIKNSLNLESISIEGVDENLSHLRELGIYNCPNLSSFPHGGLCTPNLDFFSVRECKSLKSLPERFNTLTVLRELYISDLPNIVSFSGGGLPPNLQIFEVHNCDVLMPSVSWGLHELHSLQLFEIWGSEHLLEVLIKEELLPTTLKALRILRLSTLKSFDGKGLLHLTALQRLEIYGCPSLEYLPKEGLPASLSFLRIQGCSSLKKRCQSKAGEDWPKIAHIPFIEIDEEVIIS